VKGLEINIKKILEYDSSDTCFISQKIFKELQLSTEIIYDINFGQLSKKCLLKPDETQENYMYVPDSICIELEIFEGISLNIWKKENEIFLGPVVGIFEPPWILSRIEKGGAYYYELQHIKASIAENCLCYYFTIEDINWFQKKIRGLTFNPELNEWRYCIFPMPNVIYDEGIFLKEDIKSVAKYIRKQFRGEPKIRLINSRNSFGKWELCKRLSKYKEVKKYIPETIEYMNFDDVLSMLKSHKLVFLKSFNGSKGEEVLSIKKEKKLFRLNYFDYEAKEIELADVKDLEEFIENFIGNEKYIIQQGIKLLKYEGRSFDLRVLLQKDESGNWKSTYNAARIAKGKSTITNHATGGDIIIYEDIYPHLKSSLSEESLPDSNKLAKISMEIASYIEKEFGVFGEIGMDIGIDIHGDLWIIEANAKPDKFIDEEIIDLFGRQFIKVVLEAYKKVNDGLKEIGDDLGEISPAALAIFKYAKYLSKNQN
jgi:hypothetical protein